MPVDWNDLDRIYETAEADDVGEYLIPEGVYTAQVVNISLEESKKGIPQIKWEFKILGPNYKGKHAWKYASLNSNPESMKWVKTELRRIGFVGDKISTFINSANFYIDKVIEIKTAIKEYNGNKSQVIYFRKLVDEYEGPGQIAQAPRQEPPPVTDSKHDDDIPF